MPNPNDKAFDWMLGLNQEEDLFSQPSSTGVQIDEEPGNEHRNYIAQYHVGKVIAVTKDSFNIQFYKVIFLN